MINKNEIIIYDGVCGLCNFFIRFILNKDKLSYFKVTTLQSDFTKKNCPEVTKVDSVALILKNGEILQKSRAVYYILKKVKTLFLIRFLIFILPSFFSDLVYDLVAKTRYMIFGRYDSCPILKDDLKSRIIE
tara:strand:- start:632 stop:1027 length:396 start_codon:yes stop_codon:yes gene_type:complete